jgi:hypothetical protein
MSDPISVYDKRYEPARNTSRLFGETFQTFEEANKFIRANCRYCQDSVLIDTGTYNKRHRCDMLHDLRLGMANDYPYWDRAFVRLDLKPEYKSLTNSLDLEDQLPEKLIACTAFKSKQLRFAFA